MYNTFDFDLFTEGKVVTVEVDYIYAAPDSTNDTSDWDNKGGLDIYGIRTYHNGQEVSMNIPYVRIEQELQAHIAELEMEYVLSSNIGF